MRLLLLFITALLIINQVSRLYDYYLVSFKLWNRGTDQSIEGEYKFHIN